MKKKKMGKKALIVLVILYKNIKVYLGNNINTFFKFLFL